MTRELITIAVTALLSGSLAAGVASLITGRALAGKTSAEGEAIREKLPAEVDSVVVQGAEQAVLTMRSALESATKRIGELETDRESDRRRIADLEARVNDLQGKVETAEAALADARRVGNSLRVELESFRHERERRA